MAFQPKTPQPLDLDLYQPVYISVSMHALLEECQCTKSIAVTGSSSI